MILFTFYKLMRFNNTENMPGLLNLAKIELPHSREYKHWVQPIYFIIP